MVENRVAKLSLKQQAQEFRFFKIHVMLNIYFKGVLILKKIKNDLKKSKILADNIGCRYVCGDI